MARKVRPTPEEIDRMYAAGQQFDAVSWADFVLTCVGRPASAEQLRSLREHTRSADLSWRALDQAHEAVFGAAIAALLNGTTSRLGFRGKASIGPNKYRYVGNEADVVAAWTSAQRDRYYGTDAKEVRSLKPQQRNPARVGGGGWRKRVATDKTTKPFVAYHLDKDGKQCWYACDTLLEARRVAAGGPDKQPTCRCEQVGHYTTTCKVHGTPALKPVANPGGKKGFAVVQFKGMEEVVLSVHSTQSAAQSAMRVKEGKSGRMDLRVQAFGPGTGRELVTGMGGRFLRHTLEHNPVGWGRADPVYARDAARRAFQGTQQEWDLEELRQERENNKRMEKAGYVPSPDGGWIKKTVWAAHMRKLAKRNPSAREHMARGNYDLLRAQSLQMHAADRMRGEPRQARAYGHAAAMAARAELDLQDAHATGKASEARKLYDESLASLEAFKRANPAKRPAPRSYGIRTAHDRRTGGDTVCSCEPCCRERMRAYERWRVQRDAEKARKNPAKRPAPR